MPVTVPTLGFLPQVLLLRPLNQFVLHPRLLSRLMSLPPIHPALSTFRLSRMQRCQTRTTFHPPVFSLTTLSVWMRWLPAVTRWSRQLCRPADLTPLVVVGPSADAARFCPPSPVSWSAWIPLMGRILATAISKPSVGSKKTCFPGKSVDPGNLLIGYVLHPSHLLLLLIPLPRLFWLLLLLWCVRLPPSHLLSLLVARLSIP